MDMTLASATSWRASRRVRPPSNSPWVCEFVRDNGGIEYAYERANDLCEEGLQAISPLNDSVYAESLLHLVRYTVARAS